jgi:hypothetical protein
MNKKYYNVILTIFLFFVATVSYSQNGIIAGYVIFSDKPTSYPTATVSLYISTSASPVATFNTTSTDNSFIFQNLSDGEYYIICSAAGYNNGSLANIIIEGSSVVSDLMVIMRKPMGEIVLDDTGSGLTLLPDASGWSSGSSAGYYGSGYRYCTAATEATKQAVWTLDIKVPGTYQIYSWWVAGTNRVPDAEYIIQHSQGTTTVYMNQQANGGKWNLLGTFEFSEPGTYTVTQTNKSSTAGNVVMVDALKYVNISWKPTPPASPTNVRTSSTLGQIKLTWSAVSGAVLYAVYKSTYSGGATANANKYWMPIAYVTEPEYKDTSIKSGVRYYYVVTALDDEYEESLPSIEVYDIYKPSPKMDIQMDNNKVSVGDKINISFALREIAEDSLTIRVYTISGKCVKTIVENYPVVKDKIENFVFDTAGLSTGLYLVNFFTENAVQTKKVLVTK